MSSLPHTGGHKALLDQWGPHKKEPYKKQILHRAETTELTRHGRMPPSDKWDNHGRALGVRALPGNKHALSLRFQVLIHKYVQASRHPSHTSGSISADMQQGGAPPQHHFQKLKTQQYNQESIGLRLCSQCKRAFSPQVLSAHKPNYPLSNSGRESWAQRAEVLEPCLPAWSWCCGAASCAINAALSPV